MRLKFEKGFLTIRTNTKAIEKSLNVFRKVAIANSIPDGGGKELITKRNRLKVHMNGFV